MGPGRRRILVVEDAPLLRETLVDVLTAEGYEVAEAADGIAALEALRANSQCVVVTDIAMPRMSGEEMLIELERDPALRLVPVIIHTGSRSVSSVKVTPQVVAVLKKPFKLEELREALDQAFRR
jgi:two-component system chemotaxis response regulator CheY